MGIVALLFMAYSATIVCSATEAFMYKTERLADVGKNGYKFDMDKLVDYFMELPDISTFQLFIPGYNLYKSQKVLGDYYSNKEYYFDLLCSKKIIKRMDDVEYTEYREDKKLGRLLDISSRDEKDNELLCNIRDFLFDIASYSNDYSNKKVLSFNMNDSHFDVYYDNNEDNFVTLEQTGIFEDLDDDVRDTFLLHVTKFFGDVYRNYGYYKEKINKDNNGIKLNVEDNNFLIKIKNLYEYVPNDTFEKKEESQYSKLLKK